MKFLINVQIYLWRYGNMSTWNGKRFSVYTSDEKSALGLIKELGEQTNYNTDELEQVKISDNKKVIFFEPGLSFVVTIE